MSKSNCLLFALLLKRRRAPVLKARGERGYISWRDSDHGWFPHFLWVERHHIISFKPPHPEDRLCPPALFEGTVRWGDKITKVPVANTNLQRRLEVGTE